MIFVPFIVTKKYMGSASDIVFDMAINWSDMY